ncbi:hypothetical protein Q7P35_003498 [Cladosporium inversicolor]
MKSSTVSSAVILALAIPAALGDFSIYASIIGGNGISVNTNGWQIYPRIIGAIGCNGALGWSWRKSNDVSGGKYGVRCKGSKRSCAWSGSGEGIKELELNARQTSKGRDPHFTYYANRGGAIVDLDDKILGTCKVAPEQNFYCGMNTGQAQGTRKLDCTSFLTEKDFKQPT